MSGFWTLKLSKSKQDEKKPGKKNGNNGLSGKGSLGIVRSLTGRARVETEQPVDSVQTSNRKESETSFPTTELSEIPYEPDGNHEVLEKVKPDLLEDLRNELKNRSDAPKYSNNEYYPARINIDIHTIYSENVELVVNVPIEPAAISRFYNNLEMTPEIKVLYNSGSWDRGTSITVYLEKPMPLLETITGMQGLDVSVLAPKQRDNSKRSANTLLGNNKKKITRIDLFIKTRQP
jgi:hypothetical protein